MDYDLREEEDRKRDGRDKGAILVTYAVPPEDAVVEYLSLTLPLTGLSDRKIDAPIIHGHPLFTEGISQSGTNSQFPKIGVEWVRDIPTQSLGLNEKHFKNSEEFVQYLNEIVKRSDSKRAAPKSLIDKFAQEKYFQEFSHHVESEIAIVGFASGHAGRKTSQWLFETVHSILLLMENDLPILYPGCRVLLPDSAEPNLNTQDFPEPLWGFEITVRILQVRSIFRTKPSYLFPDIKGYEIHLKGSKSRFEGGFGLADYP
ncbi:hypothetical protein [Leptospira licerasiae]|uniref:Uncharacterized protein n=1 Tax=Leptospira licerasiae str. MMD4847 TaxID=1049971 RepID=A0ABN0H9N2_9LEPT|nr:hypothetical protein [Leptospira licerasiae]EIE01440.1 hypothetical protein LEP1GSC185_3937 [Leptospira licerasiae serovar Varillal str. VAR 010]EJZ42346.1 hypothetical protein LEP1GSC178_0006 [Leptospira licerasiae str. MMD4847]